MSLWTKSISEIAFADVAAFCTTTPRPREGLRLDYKQAMPRDISSLICAFANTSGGLIVLGVKGDAKNEPIWPPVGLAVTSGVLEQLTQAANQNNYPPVPIEISNFLEDPGRPGLGVIVARIHESSQAPHAVDGGRKIYERTGDLNQPMDFAKVDRIERLLARRGKIEQRRIELRQRFLARARRALTTKEGATRWITVMPLFPGEPLIAPSVCYKEHVHMPIRQNVRRTPDGSFAATGKSIAKGVSGNLRCSGLGEFGDVCAAEFFEEEWAWCELSPERPRYLGQEYCLRFFAAGMHAGVRFLRSRIGYRGYIHISIGITSCAEMQMLPINNTGDPIASFLDDEFIDEETVMPGDMLTVDEIRPLYDRFQYAFDLKPAQMDQWIMLQG